MSYVWVKQLYLSDSCLLNSRVTDKQGDRTAMVALCDRRPGRKAEDPSKPTERYRRSECPLKAAELLTMVTVQVFTTMSVECVSDALCCDTVLSPALGSILNMETTCSSGTWLPTYRIIRSHNPESHNIKITFKTRHCTARVT
jgi:hypothetical protein